MLQLKTKIEGIYITIDIWIDVLDLKRLQMKDAFSWSFRQMLFNKEDAGA